MNIPGLLSVSAVASSGRPKIQATIRVRVQPKASGNQILGFREDILRLRVTAPPEDGAANAAVVRLLAQTLGVSRSKLEVVRGHASRDKVIRVSSLNAQEVKQRLESPA
ncbi:MAG: hypothetical protein BZY80_04620 [SAR202 cluster bacterium Io17-Chloro-G2]|nr:MAG: hypothetical protein BZY80_04620 [SAR202 cluster bacterium Io17-Chloro-G2]